MARKDVPDWLVVSMAAGIHEENQAGPDPDRPNLIRRLAFATGQPEKVLYAAAERSADRGLIQYGVSIRWPFMTDEGRALLAEDQRIGSRASE